MVQLICGVKGSGKTKRLIDMANGEVATAHGDVVFIDDDKRYIYDVKHEVRFVDVKEYGIDSEDKLYGFLSGMMAQNFDISAFYIDAFLHIIQKQPQELECFFKKLMALMEQNNIKAVINISAAPDAVPAFMQEHII